VTTRRGLTLAIEDRVFSMKTPSAFFSFYGQLGGQISADFAMEAFQDDLAVTSRTVS
jgi:syntaxin-binding protein 1